MGYVFFLKKMASTKHFRHYGAWFRLDLAILIYSPKYYRILLALMNKVLTGLATQHQEWIVASHAGAQALQRFITAKSGGTPNLDELLAALKRRMYQQPLRSCSLLQFDLIEWWDLHSRWNCQAHVCVAQWRHAKSIVVDIATGGSFIWVGVPDKGEKKKTHSEQ